MNVHSVLITVTQMPYVATPLDHFSVLVDPASWVTVSPAEVNHLLPIQFKEQLRHQCRSVQDLVVQSV